MSKFETFLDWFRGKVILLGPRLQKKLLGVTVEKNGHGRLYQFLLFALHWPSLFKNLGIAFAAALIFYLPTLLASYLWEWLTFVLQIFAKLSVVVAEIYAALLLMRGVAYMVSRWRSFFVAIGAMWLPLLVIIVSAFLLFVNDQGQELGVGLMDPDDYHKAPILAFTLIYWALNSWLAARIGLARYFDKPTKRQGYIFWGPRLIGVCAHFFAALSLSFAVYYQPDPETGVDWLLVLTAPSTIALATIFAWLLDRGSLSGRFAGKRISVRVGLVLTGLLGAVLLVWLFLRWLYAASASSPQAGLSFTALCITISALAFLIAISKLRQNALLDEDATPAQRANDEQKEQALTLLCALVLGALMILGTAAIWIWPMKLSQYLGSLTIACFAFGSFLALANLVDLFTAAVAAYARRAGFCIRPQAILGVLLAVIVLPALVASVTQSFHKVRLCDGKCAEVSELKSASVRTPDKRPDVTQAARAWYVQAERAYHSFRPKSEPVPLLIVATAGGGIRAAYWTTTILETLEKDLSLPQSENSGEVNLMRSLLFGISGVSGGSVGAAAYAAAVRNHEDNGAKVLPSGFLKEDFLAPGLAAMVFIDGLSNFLPDMGQIDRGDALELGFESASRTAGDKGGLLSHKFLNFSPPCHFHGPSGMECSSWGPILLLNATHQETGRRVITSHVKIERNVFFDSYDALQVLNSDVRLSTAAHNSARFTYVSPAGNLISNTAPVHNRGYILDGGYFENYGAETALELARKAVQVIDPDNGKPDHQNKVKLVILQISSDPKLQDNRTLVRARFGPDGCAVTSLQPITVSTSSDLANYLELIDAVDSERNEGEFWVLPSANELTAPVAGIMSVRGAHGTAAAEELAASICQGQKEAAALNNSLQRQATAKPAGNNSNQDDKTKKIERPHFTHLAMCEASGIIPPLGWVLSEHTRLQFTLLLEKCGNADELKELKTALGWPVPADAGAAKP